MQTLDRTGHRRRPRGACAVHELRLRFEPVDLKGLLAIDANACKGCGICAKVRPAGCIRMEGNVAQRCPTAGQGCNACLACIHACPAGTIRLPMGERNPQARYRNKHVALAQTMETSGEANV